MEGLEGGGEGREREEGYVPRGMEERVVCVCYSKGAHVPYLGVLWAASSQVSKPSYSLLPSTLPLAWTARFPHHHLQGQR